MLNTIRQEIFLTDSSVHPFRYIIQRSSMCSNMICFTMNYLTEIILSNYAHTVFTDKPMTLYIYVIDKMFSIVKKTTFLLSKKKHLKHNLIPIRSIIMTKRFKGFMFTWIQLFELSSVYEVRINWEKTSIITWISQTYTA